MGPGRAKRGCGRNGSWEMGVGSGGGLELGADAKVTLKSRLWVYQVAINKQLVCISEYGGDARVFGVRRT
jgi:hypothetical protein